MTTITEDHGLKVTYNEEESLITFDWDSETHPEYNYLENISNEEFSKMLWDFVKDRAPEVALDLQLENARYSRLHDAICEYIDEMDMKNLSKHLVSILKKEIKYHTDKLDQLNEIFQKLGNHEEP